MKRLRKKLQSESGASILMALLMLLVCMMAAASILGASASNAGKYRSNRVERQKHLTLSSAIQLIADEIEKAEYTGKYTVYEWDKKDTDGNVIGSYYHIKQTNGDYSCGDLKDQIPLKEELDEIFSKQFTGTGCTPLSGSDLEDSTTRTLTVTLPDGLTGYPDDSAIGDYKVPKEVTVQVKLDHATHHITLTAWLGTGSLADAGDIMIAELVAKVKRTDAGGNTVLEDDNPLVTISPPAGKTAGTEAEALAEGPGDAKSVETMTWELHWIKKGAA